MSEILKKLEQGQILISDGAMGTELQKQNLPKNYCPEELNISHPEIIRSIHQAYFDAGSDFVTTNTFGGSALALRRHGLQKRVVELNQAAVKLAREVCPSQGFVAGSIGPTGEIMEPLGSLTAEKVKFVFLEQAKAISAAGADIIFIETMMSLEELSAALMAVKEVTNIPVSASMTFNDGPTGIYTQWGVDIKSFVRHAETNGADIIASNCGKGFDEMIKVAEQIRGFTKLPVMTQANAGLPELKDGKQVYTESPEIIIPKVKKLLDLGVNIVGGCCGTGPAHISAMKRLLLGN